MFCESGEDLPRTRTLFLKICAICYSIAFLSLYPQINGLYGPNGLLPVHSLLDLSSALNKNNEYKPDVLFQLIKDRPTLLWFSSIFGLSPDFMMDLLCLIGTFVGFLIVIRPSYGHKINFLILWILYQSLYTVGQTFLWFQWDILLLEVGFLCIIVAPFRGTSYFIPRPYDHVNMMLVRWLLFRMMFASGVVKLTSGCPTWWNLTALPTHYESQCIPTPLAWFAFQQPSILQKFSVASTFFIEIGLVFLFFAPTQSLRKFTAFHQIIFMVTIMLTGNYNFFNLLYIGLCISLFDDSWIRSGPKVEFELVWSKWIPKIFNFCAYIAIFYLCHRYLITISLSDLTIDFIVKFSENDFSQFMDVGTKVSLILGGSALFFAGLLSLYKCLNPQDSYSRSRSFMRKLLNLFWTIIYITVAVFMFLLSVPIYTRGIDQYVPHYLKHPLNQIPQEWIHRSQNLHIVGSYGLFRRMTGVGGRPEVILEGSDNQNGPWKEYHFMYKPGNLSVSPPSMWMHQARLDWQMWFAALGNYERNPWFISLLQRILDNEKDVLQLMDVSKNPFPSKAPKFIRSKLYKYHFTTDISGVNWWKRNEVGEYSPPISKANTPAVKEYLKNIGILTPPKENQKSTNNLFSKILKFLRTQIIQPHHYLVLVLLIAAVPFLYHIK